MVICATGCAAGGRQGLPPASGQRAEATRWTTVSPFVWADYKRVWLAPFVLALPAQSPTGSGPQDDRSVLVEALYTQVRQDLQDADLLADSPGPGVLQVDVRITALEPANPAINLLTTALVLLPLDMGGAALEADVSDGADGRRLARFVDRRHGSPLAFKAGFERWGHCRQAFRDWTDQLKEALKG